MELYFAPLACSMASRIALYEAEAPAHFVMVDPYTKRLSEGGDFLSVNPLGLVPAIRTDDGEVLSENAAVLQYIADRFPAAALAPRDGIARSRLHHWLSFIGSELHHGLFGRLFDPDLTEEMRERVLKWADRRLAYLDRHLSEHEFLLDRFSVADGYLVTVLNWHTATGLDLKRWPAVHDYYTRLKRRPSIARAMSEEGALYEAEQARRKAA